MSGLSFLCLLDKTGLCQVLMDFDMNLLSISHEVDCLHAVNFV
jgi:hypothetical protein